VGVSYAPGHVGWRWDRLLERGVAGLMDELRQRLKSARDDKARHLYHGALILWEAVLRWNDRHVAALEQLQGERPADPSVAERLALCRRVPRHPARTCHEAVQAFHLQHMMLMYENPYGGNGPGRLDYFLWPYLERDLAEGRTTVAEAK